MLAIASQNLESSMLKEECGEATEKDRKEREQLEQEIENLEIYIEKFGTFQKELKEKVEYAQGELETLTDQITKLTKSYGLDAGNIPPKEFFEIFYQFSKEF